MAKRTIKTVAVVTGSRAEFGLLRPVIDAIAKRRDLRLKVVAAGSHFLPPARTIREVEAAYRVDGRVPMQRAGRARTREEDARSVARGVYCFTRVFAKLKPDWVVVLGDRTEAFAAASAGSIAGIGVCHIHGGDRAEGIADEAMRHAITKLAHLHCAATPASARRIVRMGERRASVHVTGSPAIDGLRAIAPMDDRAARALGDPALVVLLHPSGLDATRERFIAQQIAGRVGVHDRAVLLAPNADAGRDVIMSVWRRAARANPLVRLVEHLPREAFVALLKRLARPSAVGFRGFIIGNSSAGLIEAAALGLPAINVGPRQAGRERGANVIDVPVSANPDRLSTRLRRAILEAIDLQPGAAHPYGDGRAGPRIAALLASTNPAELIRKRNAY